MANQAHYPGDCTNYDPRLVYGPDNCGSPGPREILGHGAHYRAVAATYNAETDMTTITFKPVPPKELAELAESIMARGKPLWEGYYRE